MADKKKACVVYAPGLQDPAQQVAKEIEARGYDVCLHGATQEEVDATRAGDLPISDELSGCLAHATLCVLVIDRQDQFDGIAAHAASLGIRVVVVMVGQDAIPAGAADEAADSCVTIGSPKLGDALDGQEVWEEPDGTPKEPRPIRRQKCQ